MLLMYNYVLLKMSTWYSKHVEESNNIWRMNNIQCITLVVLYGEFDMLDRACVSLVTGSFLHDNAPSGNTTIVKQFLAQRKVTELDHPPYSPDLAWVLVGSSRSQLWTFQRTSHVNYLDERPAGLLSRREAMKPTHHRKGAVALGGQMSCVF